MNRSGRFTLAAMCLCLSAQLVDAAHQLLLVEKLGDVLRYVGIVGLASSLLVASLVVTLLLVWRFRAGDVLGALADPNVASLVYVVMASLPVFFSSVLFSMLLDGFPAADEALGSNLLGAMLGGCIEYGAIEVGYKSLTLAVPAIYVLALAIFRGQRTSPR